MLREDVDITSFSTLFFCHLFYVHGSLLSTLLSPLPIFLYIPLLSCPCLRCAVKIVQTGVKEVIYQLEYSVDDRTKKIFDESGVRFRRYVPSV